MNKTAIFFADGLEEIEALTVVDILRRANLEITTISINGTTSVTGSHNITIQTDTIFEDVNFDSFDGVVLPGGMPGTLHLGEHDGVINVIREFAASGKLVCAICAAPSVLGAHGILAGKYATSYPGFEDKLTNAFLSTDSVVTDSNIITSRGMGTAIDFALSIVSYYKDEETAAKLGEQIIYY